MKIFQVTCTLLTVTAHSPCRIGTVLLTCRYGTSCYERTVHIHHQRSDANVARAFRAWGYVRTRTAARTGTNAAQDVEIQVEASRPLARRAELSAEQQEEIREAFELFDSDNSGAVERRDLKVLLRALGFDQRREQITRVLAQVQVAPRATRIYFNEFLALMATLINEKEIGEEMVKAFNLFDVDNSGNITLDNLRNVAEQLGENMSDAELHEMIKEADVDGDGVVSVTEFLRIMKKTELW